MHWLLMRNRGINVPFAVKNMSLNRCTLITLCLGAKVERQFQITARCFAEIVT